jgi:hypothetical protein
MTRDDSALVRLRRRAGALRRRMLEPERKAVAAAIERIEADLAHLRTRMDEEHATAMERLSAIPLLPDPPALAAPVAPSPNRDAVLAHARGIDPIVELDPLTRPLDRLADAASDSAGAVVAIGVIERMAAADAVDLLRHCVRVVHAGGVVLVESANPTVLTTFSGDLYADPYVRRPFHPSLVRFLLAEAGCGSVEFEWFGAIPEAEQLSGDREQVARVNHVLFGPTRYLAIGRR